MANKECIVMPNMADRPYSAVVKAGDFIFMSGTVGGVDEKGGKIEGLEAQTKQCLENIKSRLELAGASLNDVVKVQVFLAKSEDWPIMNDVYIKYFPVDRPVRTTVVTELVNPDMLIEIECVAYKP